MNTQTVIKNGRMTKVVKAVEPAKRHDVDRDCNNINLVNQIIPIWEKINLTIEEASAYSNIGICRLNELAKRPNCPFVLYIGKKKLVKREKFEKYISDAIEL